MIWVGVALLGGIGSLARFWLGTAVERRSRLPMPALGTFTVNTLGCLLAGILAGAGAHGDTRLLLAGGGLGAFTTFSTWVVEAERGSSYEDVMHIVGGLAAGLGAVAAAWAL